MEEGERREEVSECKSVYKFIKPVRRNSLYPFTSYLTFARADGPAIPILLDITTKEYYPLKCVSQPVVGLILILDTNVFHEPEIFPLLRAPMPNIKIYITRGVLSQEMALQLNVYEVRESKRLIANNPSIIIQNAFWENKMTDKYGSLPVNTENRIIDEKIHRTAKYLAEYYGSSKKVIILSNDGVLKIESRHQDTPNLYTILTLNEFLNAKKRKGEELEDEPPAKKAKTG